MDSCSDTFGNLIPYFAFRRYLVDLKSFRRLLGFEMVEKESKNITENQKCTEIHHKTVKYNDFCPIGVWCASAYLGELQAARVYFWTEFQKNIQGDGSQSSVGV